MACNEETYRARDAVLSRANELIQHAITQDKRVYLICPQRAWANDRKIQSASLFPRGVSVDTWNTFFSGLWELWGDGRQIISSALRTTLFAQADILKQQTLRDKENDAKNDASADRLPRTRGVLKPSFAQELSVCLDEIAFSTHWDKALQGLVPTLSQAEQEVMSIYQTYFERANSLHRIDPVELEQIISQQKINNACIIFEAPDALSIRKQAILKTLGSQNEVWVLIDAGEATTLPHHSPELQQLATRLYTKDPGITATGSVVVGEAVGPRATPALVAQMAAIALKNSNSPDLLQPPDVESETARRSREDHAAEGVALVLPRIADADPLLFEELVKADIPFNASFEVPLNQVLLGSTLLAVFELAQQAGELGDRYDNELLYQLVSSPYFTSGDASDAWSIQRTWRSNRALEHNERLEAALEISTPELKTLLRLACENVTKHWQAELSDCLNQMLLNATSKGRRTPANTHDDAACVRAIIHYVEEIVPARARCSSVALAHLNVELNRFYPGSDAGKNRGITLITPDDLGLQHFAAIIMGNVSADAYPMSEKPSSLTSLMKKLECVPKKTLASRQRALLLHTIEAATDCFMFYRETFDAQGEEARQSALWDELLANYHSASEGDAPEGNPERIPFALEPFTVRIYEGNWLKEQAQGIRVAGSKQIERGMLEGEAVASLFVKPISPTALERYLQCPYAWFINRRLRARSIDETFDGAHLGSFMHEVLHRLYAQIIAEGMRRVTPQNLSTALSMLDALYINVQREYANDGKQLAVSATEQLTLDALLPNLRKLITRDATFLPGFEPRFLEASIGNETDADYAGIRIIGCIDRIDVNADGQAVIIDYKMSTDLKAYGLPKKEAGFPAYLQGAIYARIAQREFGLTPVGSLYRSYSRASTRGLFDSSLLDGIDRLTLKEQGMSTSDALPWSNPETALEENKASITTLDYTEYLNEVEELARDAVRRIRQGDIAPHPTTDSVCRYCAVADNCSRRRGGSSWR